MPSVPPSTIAEILATGTIAPAFAAALAEAAPSTSYTLAELKQLDASVLPSLQQCLTDSRPPDITEVEHSIPLRDDYRSRIIICHRTSALESTAAPAPLIVLFHGGGHCLGHPEDELLLARALAAAHSAIVICASYRLSPEFPFPFSICDAWETLEFAARESRKSNSAIFPRCTDVRTGFIVGGTSSGASLAAALAHLARDHNLHPPVTGQLLCAGTYISDESVPADYRDRYLSLAQNRNAPILDEALVRTFREAFQPDVSSKLYASLDQHDPRDGGTGSVRHGHLGVAPAYFQVCGLDMFRDDGLIY